VKLKENSIALRANNVTVVKDRPIMSVNIVSQFQWPPCRAISLRKLSHLYHMIIIHGGYVVTTVLLSAHVAHLLNS